MKKLIVLLCFALLAVQGFGATYYVDATGGNDNNTGTSTSAPWQTLTKVETAGIAAGDTVLFKRGETWKDQLAIPQSGTNESTRITFGAYGNGAPPVITAIDAVTGWAVEGNWTNVSGNIWSMSLTHDPRRIWINGEEETKLQTNTAPTATYKWGWASNVLYVYSAGGNPATAFTSLDEAGARTSAIDCYLKNYITVQGLDLRGGRSTTLVVTGDYLIVEDCNVGLGAGVHGILAHAEQIGSASTVSNGIVRRCLFDSGDHEIHTYEYGCPNDGIKLSNGSNNWKVYDNIFRDWGHTAMYVSQTVAGYTSSNNEIYDNFFSCANADYGRSLSIDGLEGGATGNKMYRNYAYKSRTRNQINGNNNYFFLNIIDGVENPPWTADDKAQGVSLEGYSPSVCHDNWIANNVIMNCSSPAVAVWGYAGAANKYNNRICNNILYNTGAGPVNANFANRAIFVDAHASVLGNYYENNLIYCKGEASPVYYRAQYAISVATFNSGESDGDFTNGNIATAPVFYGPSNGTDLNYRPTIASPVINAGTAGIKAFAPADYQGITWGVVDIGPFEYVNLNKVRKVFGNKVFGY